MPGRKYKKSPAGGGGGTGGTDPESLDDPVSGGEITTTGLSWTPSP